MNKGNNRNEVKIGISSNGSSVRNLAVLSGKGGTGKTIIATSMGYILSHCGFKTLLVDMDLFSHGMTFYGLGEYRRKSEFSTADIFCNDRDDVYVAPVSIPHPFANENLYILPSISRGQRLQSELNLSERYKNLSKFTQKVAELIRKLIDQKHFDYVIVDSRGGTDYMTIGLALGAEAYIVVTEADKPSWDMGKLLLDSIEDAEARENILSERIGFIINKNVLPPEAIEAFLRKEWQAPHLATIPLDENAVRCFQEDKVPVSEDIGCPFSSSIIQVVRKVFVSEKWSEPSIDKLKALEEKSRERTAAKKREMRAIEMRDRLSLVFRMYGTLLATGMLAILGFSIIRKKGTTTPLELFLVLGAAILVFLMSFSDPNLLQTFFKIMLRHREKKD